MSPMAEHSSIKLLLVLNGLYIKIIKYIVICKYSNSLEVKVEILFPKHTSLLRGNSS